jgi:capsular polysaccharide biosynthesis protein
MRSRLKDLAQLRHSCHRVNEALWVHDDWSGNYFHWLTDVLPKLQAWLEAGLPCRSVLVPHALLQRSYVHDSLRWLGFEPIAWNGTRLRVERLVVINATAPTGNFRAALLRRLGQQLRQSSAAAAAHEGTPERVYISRADAARRFLRNEAELMPTLATHQLQAVQLEGRSLAEQVALFGNCRLLVGLHGAGLTNMLWMPAGSRVVEIRRRGDHHNNCYYVMACALGHQYSYLQAEDLQPGGGTYSAELQLDPVLLDQLLCTEMEGRAC